MPKTATQTAANQTATPLPPAQRPANYRPDAETRAQSLPAQRVAEMCNCSPKQVHHWCAEGVRGLPPLPSYYGHGQRLIVHADLIAWVEAVIKAPRTKRRSALDYLDLAELRAAAPAA